jgi:DnaJ like chaperone protein
MRTGKWIGGFMGFIAGGPLGALAGFILGALFDHGIDAVNKSDNSYSNDTGDYENFQRQQTYEGQRNSFLFSLLVLASYIIKADGRIMHSEMEFVRGFLNRNFGPAAEEQGDAILKKLFEQQKVMGQSQFRATIQQCSAQIAANMDYSQRLQLLNFLVLIAQADGYVSPEEVDALNEIASYMGLSAEEVNSMLHLQSDDLDSAYKVLGISSDATDDEVKSAYRKMALKHHPDRVATLGEDVRKAAEKKFQEINDAKERIYKARGL